jgi:hypothetical protein
MLDCWTSSTRIHQIVNPAIDSSPSEPTTVGSKVVDISVIRRVGGKLIYRYELMGFNQYVDVN